MTNDRLKHCCATFLRGLRLSALPTVVIALVLAGLAVYYTLAHLTISTSRNDLVASNKKLIKLSEQMTQAFGGRDGMVVVVENGSHQSRAVKFADALAAELRRYPDRFPDLFYRLNPDVFKPWALLYLEKKELVKLKDNILGQQKLLQGLAADPQVSTFYRLVNEQIAQAMIGHLFTGFLEEKTKELPDVTLLNATLEQLRRGLEAKEPYVSPFQAFFPKELSDLSEQGYFFTEDDKFLLFLVTPQPDGYITSSQNLKLLRDVVHRVNARFPELKVGVTGPDALEADEMNEALDDITLATWLSLAGQMGLLILFLRSLRRTLVEGLVLIIGLCWTFGLVTLLVGHLNLLSMIFAPLMLGLTIDYGIHWFCRLEEEEDHRPCSFETLSCALRQTLPGIVYAGLAAMVSFLPLAFVGFKGLAELGLILTLGIFIMLVATLLLAPSLVVVSERCVSRPHQCPGKPHPFLHLRWKRPGVVVALGALITVLGIVCLFYVKFDLNPLHLQNQATESVVWENRLLKQSKYSTSYGALATASLAELQARSEALKKLPTVSHVESILSFMPSHPEEKRPILEEMTPVLTAIHFGQTPAAPSDPQDVAAILKRINFKMDEAAKNLEAEKAATAEQIQETHRLINQIIPLLNPEQNQQAAPRLAEFGRHFFADLHGKWNLFLTYEKSALESPPMTLSDLPQAVRERFVSPGGTYLLRVFPSQDIWNFEPLEEFVQSLWGVDPQSVGDPVLLYVFTLGFRNSILWAAGLALLAIAVMLVILFRSLKMAGLALIPLVVGTGLTLCLMWLLGLPFNQANVLFLPLILGEGIEFGIIILARWKLEESARAITLPASTAKGVALAALTTTLGFGSLMVSGHRGTFSLGLLATVGSLSVLLASLSILPAFLRLGERERQPQPLFSLNLTPVRWLNHMVRKKTDEKTALDH